MIKSNSQLRRTQEQVAAFKAALKKAEARPAVPGMSDDLSAAYLDSLRGQLAQLEAEIEHYNRLKSGDVTVIEIKSLDELPAALLETRIARGVTQTAIARSLGVAQQQVQRWEADEYQSASFPMLCEIARVLGITLSDGIRIESREKYESHKGKIAV